MTETAYRLNFEMADAQPLIGGTADITAWDDDDRTIEVTYRAAAVTAASGPDSGWLTITTAGAVLIDVDADEVLGVRPPERGLNVRFADICRVAHVCASGPAS
jgi:hypothetical protein